MGSGTGELERVLTSLGDFKSSDFRATMTGCLLGFGMNGTPSSIVLLVNLAAVESTAYVEERRTDIWTELLGSYQVDLSLDKLSPIVCS